MASFIARKAFKPVVTATTVVVMGAAIAAGFKVGDSTESAVGLFED